MSGYNKTITQGADDTTSLAWLACQSAVGITGEQGWGVVHQQLSPDLLSSANYRTQLHPALSLLLSSPLSSLVSLSYILAILTSRRDPQRALLL